MELTRLDQLGVASKGRKAGGEAIEEGGTGRAGALRDVAAHGGGWLARHRVETANRQVDEKKSPSWRS